ncbi:MAG: GPR endopeptidase [Clostridia bacterium]|nr:GPR endopeptidase [Clostridia bacterium]
MNKCYLNFRTDMADERVDTYKRVHNLSEIDGVEVKSKSNNNVLTTTVNVLNENGSTAVSKKIGKYVTMKIHDIKYMEEADKQDVIAQVAQEISELVGTDKKKSVLIVGLGNIYVTPDALGPKVVQNLDLTRHLLKFAKDLIDDGTREISAISPGVLGTTGIETSEIIFSIVQKTRPDIVVVIDSLASQSVDRVGTTIQLSNTGITPGAGVKNAREGINEDTLNIPVIALGVPTVVDMATITNEAIDKMINNAKTEIDEFVNENIKDKNTDKVFNILEQDNRYNMIANVLNTENYIVTPKEIDDIIDKVSEIIASSLNVALQR